YIGSMSFDIMKSSKRKFSENSIVLMNSITQLINIIISLISNEFKDELYEESMIKVLLNTLEIHDEYTTNHSSDVAVLAKKLGIKLELPKKDIERLYWAGIVHDIGKIEVPYEILNKKDRLTVGEYELIKSHPVIGYEALSSLESLKDISIYVKHHHERIDGDGYPDALKGDEIPYISKILTVVDSWDAMTSKRPYREPLTIKEAVDQLKKNSCKQFDGQIVNVFLKLLYDENLINEKLYNEKVN
ncbi:HD-GYP domain-containing protein, partial [Clostridiaceae bacterium HSG29]|nr:HD-GYP domain-containing protein [Clostridiaceae bacterium HSG29]